MPELKLLSEADSRNAVGDWAIRGGVALVFFIFGMEKFSSTDAHWVPFFHQVGLGDWFRYFTGIVEVLGALLVLIPRTALIGLALLALTMAGAVLILIFVMGQPADSPFPGAFFVTLVAIAWHQWIRRRTV